MIRTFRRRFSRTTDDRGQTLSEYSVLMGLICLVVIGALPQLGGAISDFFSTALQAVLGG